MKKIFSIIIALFSISFVSCNEKESNLEINTIVGIINEKYDTEYIVEEGDFDKKTYSTNINDYQVNIFEKYYSNANVDMDDWYNSKDMKYLYDQIRKNKPVNYNFGNKETTSFVNNVYITNYFVFAIGDSQDIRFERFIILFFPEKAIIVQIADKNIEKYLEELLPLHYIINTDGVSWSAYEAIVSLLDDLPQGKLLDTNIEQYYNFSGKILEQIMFFIDNHPRFN